MRLTQNDSFSLPTKLIQPHQLISQISFNLYTLSSSMCIVQCILSKTIYTLCTLYTLIHTLHIEEFIVCHLGSGLFRFSRIFLDIAGCYLHTHNVSMKMNKYCPSTYTHIMNSLQCYVACFCVESKQIYTSTSK